MAYYRRLYIDKNQFEELCSLQCTTDEIAQVCRCSSAYLRNWVKRNYNMSLEDALERYRSDGKVSLRRAQFKLAQTNPTMSIFLGKQYLGQSDNPGSNNVVTPIEDLNGALDRAGLDQPDGATE